jgi:hypothetical protein
MEPAVAVKADAPDDVNCCVAPRFTEIVTGAMLCGGGGPLFTATVIELLQTVPGFFTQKVLVEAAPW